jgi:hypothetical protein
MIIIAFIHLKKTTSSKPVLSSGHFSGVFVHQPYEYENNFKINLIWNAQLGA